MHVCTESHQRVSHVHVLCVMYVCYMGVLHALYVLCEFHECVLHAHVLCVVYVLYMCIT